MNMKKTLIAIVATVLLFSCNKKDDVKPNGINGYWIGLYSHSTDGPLVSFHAALFRENGTVRAFDSFAGSVDTTYAKKFEGTYQISGNTLVFKYLLENGSEIVHTATVNNDFTAITGVWKNQFDQDLEGKFTFNRP